MYANDDPPFLPQNILILARSNPKTRDTPARTPPQLHPTPSLQTILGPLWVMGDQVPHGKPVYISPQHHPQNVQNTQNNYSTNIPYSSRLLIHSCGIFKTLTLTRWGEIHTKLAENRPTAGSVSNWMTWLENDSMAKAWPRLRPFKTNCDTANTNV